MIIVYGTRFFGRSDAIEGLGHVTCRFVHIMFVPLVPIETVFMMEGDRGIKMPFSFKAAMSGWLRGGALITGIGCLIGAVANFADAPLVGIMLGVIGALSLGSFPLWGLIFGHCSAERRAEIMRMFGMEAAPSAPAGAMGYTGAPGYAGAPVAAPAYAPNPMQQGGPMPSGPMQPAGGFGAPNPYGAPPPPHGYGAPVQQSGAYGTVPQSYGGPAAGAYGGPAAGAYGAPAQSYTGPAAQGYGAPPAPQQAVGQSYGGPPPGWDPNRR